eukprot:6342442-Prymnesium_polylepis.1
MATRPRRVEEAGRSAQWSSKRSEATKSNQHLFFGQIPGISPDYGDACVKSPSWSAQPRVGCARSSR